ncbi:hypothetical protein FRC18_002790 [Serendipita sp. 400]|nr:hypothetical protein FRC18_002790 [Serendipita sp. 400]
MRVVLDALFLTFGLTVGLATGKPVGLSSSIGPVVDLGYAAYVGNSTSPAGVVNSSVTFFGGIPYVQPPLGQLRFRAPKLLNEKYNATRTVTDARKWGPTCVQQPAVEGVGVEDCLSLNVWKPTSAKAGDRLSVFVYIHGGGFFFGSSPQFPMYDWVAQNPNIIAVSMNYRLHLFGFLDGTAVRADGTPNAGLLDQRAAIEWVRRHISQFGGDPDQITIAGESAGGASVVLQATAYGGVRQAPFKRAIAQSIGLYPLPLDSEIEGVFRNVTTAASCPTEGTEAMACLRSAPLSTLIKSINSVRTNFLAPTIDGKNGFLPDLPSKMIRESRFSPGLDLIAGHCTNDGQNFAGNPANLHTDADIVATIVKRYRHMVDYLFPKGVVLAAHSFCRQMLLWQRYWNSIRAPTSQDLHSLLSTSEHGLLCRKLFLDAWINIGQMRRFREEGRKSSPIVRASNPYMGAMHASDVYYMFNGATGTVPFFAPFNATEVPVSQEIIGYWTSFTETGDPSKHKMPFSPAWPNFTGTRRVVMREDLSGNGTRTASFVERIPVGESTRCKWWMSQNETRV